MPESPFKPLPGTQLYEVGIDWEGSTIQNLLDLRNAINTEIQRRIDADLLTPAERKTRDEIRAIHKERDDAYDREFIEDLNNVWEKYT